MPIVTKEIVCQDSGTSPYKASRFYITIPSKYISESYELTSGTKINAKIIKVEYGAGSIQDLIGKNITLILAAEAVFDRLYISKDDWNEHFRELGMVEPGYPIVLEIFEFIEDKKKIPLYSKNTIKIGM